MHLVVTYTTSTKLSRGMKGYKKKVVSQLVSPFLSSVPKVGPMKILFVVVYRVAPLFFVVGDGITNDSSEHFIVSRVKTPSHCFRICF